MEYLQYLVFSHSQFIKNLFKKIINNQGDKSQSLPECFFTLHVFTNAKCSDIRVQRRVNVEDESTMEISNIGEEEKRDDGLVKDAVRYSLN